MKNTYKYMKGKIINEKAKDYTMLTRFNIYPASNLKIGSFDDNNIN